MTLLAFLFQLIIFLFVAGAILWIVHLILTAWPIPAPFVNLAYALVILVLLVIGLNAVGWLSGGRWLSLR